jgi:transcriptional regulator with XRE-family HTH domain
MTGSSYGERDYAFGQLMLTLRTTIGLTQASLGDRLGVSRHAVAEWEGGSNYPKVERLKQLIALGVQQQVFPAGREVKENVKSIVKYGRFTHTKPPCRQRMLLGAMSMAC